MYVGNVAAFLKHLLDHSQPGYRLYNYVDQPDLTMNELVSLVLNQLSVNSCQSQLVRTRIVVVPSSFRV